MWGIHTLGMLAACAGERSDPTAHGASRQTPAPISTVRCRTCFDRVEPAFTLKEHMELDTPVELLDALLFVMSVMLEQLIFRAAARLLTLASVTVTLTLEGGAAHSRTIRPALPTDNKRFLIKLLHLDLEAHPPQAARAVLCVDTHCGAGSRSPPRVLPRASKIAWPHRRTRGPCAAIAP